MATQNFRYTVLDSYRALAALYVVGFHYFYRWTDLPLDKQLIPATPVLSSSSIVEFGYLGVEFFFIISGYVIALTLNSTKTFLDFAVKRVARLFPGMLVCAAFTFLAVKLLYVQPFSSVEFVDFIPSLTFISPRIFNTLFDIDSRWISAVYWSLFVEVKFYFFAALIYFLAPKKFLLSFFWFSLILSSVYWISVASGVEVISSLLTLVFFPKYAFLFVAGMAYQAVHQKRTKITNDLIVVIIISIIYSMLVYSPLNPAQPTYVFAMAMIVIFHILFVLFIVDARILAPLKSSALAKVGAASYSLYLLHESIGVSLIRRLNEDVVSSSLWPFAVALVVIALSIVFYDHVETPARRLIRNIYASRSRERH